MAPMSYIMKSKFLQMKFKAFYDLTSIYIEISFPWFPLSKPQFLNLMHSFNKHF